MGKYQAKILILDDDPAILTTARLFLKQKFEYVLGLRDPKALLPAMQETSFDVVLLDMNYAPGQSDGRQGLELIKEITSNYPDTEVIPVTAYGEIELAVEALKLGARDFVTKPWQNEKLLATIHNLLNLRVANSQVQLLTEANSQLSSGSIQAILGSSLAIQKTRDLIKKVAPTEASVLILGENGVGKELVARQIHRQSDCSDKPFVSVDLGAIPANLFESELFGHKKGAFTDAIGDKLGKFQIADGGTIFLDEIGNLGLDLQAKLLSVLQQKTISPVGSNSSVPVNVRVIVATNCNLDEKIESGDFRQDLLYRINTIEITVPPLRERNGDIAELADYFFQLYKKKYQKKIKLSKEAVNVLEEHLWPGNVRELSHTMERCVILTNGGTTITPADLGLYHNQQSERETLNLEEMEKTLILKSLKKNNGNITHAARDLGIDRQALYRRLEKYGL
ncbi:MAG: sigma-54 dependent transcriptional regulator [Cyclobacteriaceae bacterium]